MTKKEFLDELKKGLCGLPEEDVTRSVEFYSEMIDDKIEDGKSEEEAVGEIGAVKDVISQILAETPITKLIKEKVKQRRKISALEIVLLVIGSPIWLSLLIAALAIALSLYVVMWSVIISFWAVLASLEGAAFGCIVSGIVFIVTGNAIVGLAFLSASLVCTGLSIFCFFGCKAATKGLVILTQKMLLGVKNCFVKKEDMR